MKKINVFLSSTFRDMNDERTYLAINIFPSIRRKCIQEGIDFSWIDLRWGITDEEAEKGLVVPKCLKSIDDCKPYFIGIIGNDYGTSIYAEDIEKLNLPGEEKANLLNCVDDLDEGISITEIESEYYRIKSKILYIDNALVYIDDKNVINSFYRDYLEIKGLLYAGCCGHAKKELEVLLQSCLLRIGLKTNDMLIHAVIDKQYEDVDAERSAEDMISYDAKRKRDVAILKILQSYYANRNSFCPPEYYINSALKILKEIEDSGEMHVADDISNCYNRLLLLKS